MMRFVTAAALAVAMTTTAYATDLSTPKPAAPPQDERPYVSPLTPSCYVQALGGAGINGAKASDGSGYIESVSASGWTLAAGFGCDARLGRVVIGALGRYEIPVQQDKDLFEVKGSWLAAARAGYMVNPQLLLYGLVGVNLGSWQLGDISQDTKGLVLGAGAEIGLTEALSLTLEYSNTQYGKWTEGDFKINPEAHAMRVGMSYRFGSLFGR